jgi:hypothetical protein
MTFAKIATLKSSGAVLFGLLFLTDIMIVAQNPLIKDELAAVQQSELTNQTKLSHYTWQETQIISINGEAVDYRLYSAGVGANGQYHRNLMTESTGQEATLKPPKKKRLSTYGSYAHDLCELSNQYTSLNVEQLTQASNRGESDFVRDGNLIKLAIKNYLKSGDSVVMAVDQHTHRLLRVQARSYLTDPQDAVTIQAEFAELPDGTNHVSTVEIDSVNRHLTVKLTSWLYQ